LKASVSLLARLLTLPLGPVVSPFLLVSLLGAQELEAALNAVGYKFSSEQINLFLHMVSSRPSLGHCSR
jgi:hypothetical protein